MKLSCAWATFDQREQLRRILLDGHHFSIGGRLADDELFTFATQTRAACEPDLRWLPQTTLLIAST